MGFLASHVATIPKQGFQWYLIFLEAAYEDDIKRDIDTNFSILAREVGKDTLVVRGLDPTGFRESVFEASAFYDDKWRKRANFPSLLVTNRVPDQAVSDAHILEKGKAMIFPLADIHREHKSLAGFLSDLVEALKNEDAIAALEKMDKEKVKAQWGWLNRYVKMEPGFFGFGVRLNEVMKDLVGGR